MRACVRGSRNVGAPAPAGGRLLYAARDPPPSSPLLLLLLSMAYIGHLQWTVREKRPAGEIGRRRRRRGRHK
jgi:hypothetical protein